jgi:hypothetical protein
MPRPYPAGFRQWALDLVRPGRPVAEVAGLPGTDRVESAELIGARPAWSSASSARKDRTGSGSPTSPGTPPASRQRHQSDFVRFPYRHFGHFGTQMVGKSYKVRKVFGIGGYIALGMAIDSRRPRERDLRVHRGLPQPLREPQRPRLGNPVEFETEHRQQATTPHDPVREPGA